MQLNNKLRLDEPPKHHQNTNERNEEFCCSLKVNDPHVIP